MRALTLLLKIKVGLTVLAWCLPLLLLPAGALVWLGFPSEAPMIFLRLLAMAYLALVVGYLLGLAQLRCGVYPWATVWVGIVSNGGACALLTIASVSGDYSNWGVFARVFMNLSAWAAGFITVGLAVLASLQALAERRMGESP